MNGKSTEWNPTAIRTRDFNSDGTVSSYLSQTYENGALVNSSKANYEYNQAGLITVDNREIWKDGLQEWGPHIRFERTYNTDNTLLTLTHYSRDLTGTILDLRYIRTYTTVDDVITEWITDDYNNGVISGSDKTEVFLNTENEPDSTYTYEWNAGSSTWDLKSRYIYPEDIAASIRTYQTDLYQELTGTWDPQFRHVYSDYPSIGEVQYWDRMRSDAGESEFYLDSRLEYFWSSNTVDVKSPTEAQVKIVMANPFTGIPQIHVDGVKEPTTLAIYDIAGKLVFTKRLKNSDRFTLDKKLPSGNYILHLIQANKIITVKKVIKIG